jgi:hypothetical protein
LMNTGNPEDSASPAVPARKVARLDGARHPPALHNRAEPVGAERGSGAAALGAT